MRALARCEAVFAGSDDDARGEALDVPFPRPGKRLVEVVRVEDERPLRRSEQAEVRDVRVAAGLDGDVAARRGRQVERHHGRRAAVEGERRGSHPTVTQGEKIGESVRFLGEDDRDRVPTLGHLQRALPAARRRLASSPPDRGTLRDRDPRSWRPGVEREVHLVPRRPRVPRGWRSWPSLLGGDRWRQIGSWSSPDSSRRHSARS